MNPEHVKLSCDTNKSEPPVKVYRNRADLVREEICNPIAESGLNPKDFRIVDFANDFTAVVDAHNLYGHVVTFKPDALLSMLDHYTYMTKAEDLEVGNRVRVRGSDSTIVAKTNVYETAVGNMVVLAISSDVDPDYPTTYTVSSQALYRLINK